MDVVLYRAMDCGVRRMEARAHELQLRTIAFPAFAAGNRDHIRAALLLAAGREEIGAHAAISARPVPAFRNTGCNDAWVYRRNPSGRAEAIFRDVRIFCCASDRHGRRMGYGKAHTVAIAIGERPGSSGRSRCDITIARMDSRTRWFYSFFCVPGDCGHSELSGNTYYGIGRSCKVGSGEYVQRCSLPVR